MNGTASQRRRYQTPLRGVKIKFIKRRPIRVPRPPGLPMQKRYFVASALISRAIHGMVSCDEADLRPALTMTKEATGKVGRVYHGLPHFAEVTVQVTKSRSEPGVLVRCSGDRQPASQGYVEDVPAEGYNDWKQGAILGAQYALEVAGQSNMDVVVTRILGLTTDTNPTVVGAATIYAVWQALDYPAAQEQANCAGCFWQLATSSRCDAGFSHTSVISWNVDADSSS